jgi:hypothetical protein
MRLLQTYFWYKDALLACLLLLLTRVWIFDFDDQSEAQLIIKLKRFKRYIYIWIGSDWPIRIDVETLNALRAQVTVRVDY